MPISSLPSSITLTPLRIPLCATHPEPMTEPPPQPPESTQLPDRMPRAEEAWRRAAAREFAAGTHGPVELPCNSELPTPGTDAVFLASNYHASSRLPPAERAFLARKTATELFTGAIERVTDWSQVAAILPMFVVTNSSGKQRVIFDARALNALLSPAAGSVRYESVRDALVDAAVCTKLDVASAFRHVAVAEHHTRYLCFEVEGVLYRYKTLPFGVSWSPALFIRALAPAIARVRALLPAGARIVWYVDDLLILAPDANTLDAATATTINELLDSGWAVSPEKTYPYAFREIVFLGLTVDLTGTTTALRVPQSKADRIRTDALLIAASTVVRAQLLQKLTGRLEFVRIVLPQIGFLRRGLDAAVTDGLRALHACVPVRPGERLHADLISIASAALKFTEARLTARDTADRRHLGTVYSDASAVGWGALWIHPDAPMLDIPPEITSRTDLRAYTVGNLFSAHERTTSSGAREVRAITDAVRALGLRGGDVTWHSDATVAVSAISRWRSKSNDVAEILLELWDLLLDLDLRVSVTHVFRDAELMPVADWLSRRGWRDLQAEWGVASADVAAICRRLGCGRPSADLFASSRNAIVHPYCSRWAEPGSMGDAFFCEWASPGRLWWAFPPISQTSRFSHRLLGHLRRASEARAASPAQAHHDKGWSLVLIYPVLHTPPTFLSELLPLAARDILVCVPSGKHSPSVVPDTATATASRRPVCPDLRLLKGDRPAPKPPPWPLRAALFNVR